MSWAKFGAGDWRAADVSWRKSIRLRSNQNQFTRYLDVLSVDAKEKLNIPRDRLALRLFDSKGEAQAAGFLKGDIIVAFDGKELMTSLAISFTVI